MVLEDLIQVTKQSNSRRWVTMWKCSRRGQRPWKFHQHFELAQDSRRRSLEAEFTQDGKSRVKSILNIGADPELNAQSMYYMRLSGKSFPDHLKGEQLEVLIKFFQKAHDSEALNFLIDVNARSQWLRTVIGHENFQAGKLWTSANIRLSNIVVQSNIVPYDPYWPGGNDSRDHFPACLPQEALDEDQTLAEKLQEWALGDHSTIGVHRNEQTTDSRYWLWEIQDDDVEPVKKLATGVWLIKWQGGMFVRKETLYKAEFELVQRVSHPHIVYTLGDLAASPTTYFMEYMSNDLRSFMLDRKRRVGMNKPPFPSDEAVGILLQIAKAMAYMHGEDVNVVHCDLKSTNILVSEIAEKQYLVKVADFGSARSGVFNGSGFIAGLGTTVYMAPEALQQLRNKTTVIRLPHKIDVYSFGIIAFEVLTGSTKYCFGRSPLKFKEGVIDGSTRPRLRDELRRGPAFVQDEELILLVKRCWHGDAAERPSFEMICEDLDRARDRLRSEAMSPRKDTCRCFF